jgi:hypothetical protein
MSAIAMEICPLCATCPSLVGRWRLQVRCSCGACGPRMKTVQEAIVRWNSVVGFLRKLKSAGVAARDLGARRDGPVGLRRLVRGIGWQCGFPSDGY